MKMSNFVTRGFWGVGALVEPLPPLSQWYKVSRKIANLRKVRAKVFHIGPKGIFLRSYFEEFLAGF